MIETFSGSLKKRNGFQAAF
jgi:hypothetical protein